MKKVIPTIAALLILSSCLPISFPGFATPTALIKNTDTPPSVLITSQPHLITNTPLPSSTPVIANSTATLPLPTTPSPADTLTFTPSPDLTVTLATATDLPINPTITSPATLPAGQPSVTPTLGIMKYGTLPPAVPFNGITLWNRSKVQAYISLQVTTNDGQLAIIEYPVEGQVRIKAPIGKYVYVAWVGGNKLTGGFRLTSANSLVIILYKDKVVIK